MRLARKLMLLTAMALIATAFGATNAFAQETSVEVVNEDTGELCNPCFVEAHGESEIDEETFGFPVSGCEDTFEGEVFHDGTGHITTLDNADHDTHNTSVGCTRQMCDTEETGGTAWPITSPGELGGETGHMTVDFCLEDKDTHDGDANCLAEVNIEEDPTGTGRLHHYEFTVDEHCEDPQGNTRVIGDWETQVEPSHDEIEFNHDVN